VALPGIGRVLAETTLREVEAAATRMGLTIDVLKASTSPAIEEGFVTMADDRAKALFVQPDGFFSRGRVQFAILGVLEMQQSKRFSSLSTDGFLKCPQLAIGLRRSRFRGAIKRGGTGLPSVSV
jgi:hypothetical protein